MNSVKNALTRKFGPAPAWVWAVVVGVALYFYRRRAGAGAAGSSGVDPTTAFYGPYGENPYPIAGGGSGVSGGGGNGSGGGNGGGGSGSGTPNPPVINPPTTPPTTPAPPGKSPGKVPKRGRHGPVKPKYAPKGSEHTGPKSPGKGWRGIGGGWWAPPKHKKPRGGSAGSNHNPDNRNRGSITVGTDRVKTQPRTYVAPGGQRQVAGRAPVKYNTGSGSGPPKKAPPKKGRR